MNFGQTGRTGERFVEAESGDHHVRLCGLRAGGRDSENPCCAAGPSIRRRSNPSCGPPAPTAQSGRAAASPKWPKYCIRSARALPISTILLPWASSSRGGSAATSGAKAPSTMAGTSDPTKRSRVRGMGFGSPARSQEGRGGDAAILSRPHARLQAGGRTAAEAGTAHPAGWAPLEIGPYRYSSSTRRLGASSWPRVFDQITRSVHVDQQGTGRAEPADVVAAVEQKPRRPAIGLDFPFRRLDVGRDFDDAADVGHEFAAGQFVFQNLADGRGILARSSTSTSSRPSASQIEIQCCGSAIGNARTGSTPLCRRPELSINTSRPQESWVRPKAPAATADAFSLSSAMPRRFPRPIPPPRCVPFPVAPGAAGRKRRSASTTRRAGRPRRSGPAPAPPGDRPGGAC